MKTLLLFLILATGTLSDPCANANRVPPPSAPKPRPHR